MTSISYEDARHRPLNDMQDVAQRAADLVGRATGSRVWILLIDRQNRQLPTIVPIEDVPLDLDPPSPAPFRLLLRSLSEIPDVAAIAVVLERRGSKDLTRHDQAWLRIAHDAVLDAGLMFSGAVVSSSGGVRMAAADDWV